MSCATRCRSMRWTGAASISARRAVRSMRLPTAAIPGTRSSAICRRLSRWRPRRYRDVAILWRTTVIRVILPAHLRTLARVGNDEVQVQVSGQPTLGAVLDAIEASYPVLRGTIRDYGTEKRRPFVRFFACEQDLSHESPSTLLPDAVVRGAEPFLVVGATAGG